MGLIEGPGGTYGLDVQSVNVGAAPSYQPELLMLAYILKRLALMIPTLFGIVLVAFVIVQFVPGGPVERMIAELQGHSADATARFSGGMSDTVAGGGATQNTEQASAYRGAQGLDPDFYFGA